MGIHYVFGYSGYEKSFLRTFTELLDTYCHGCHTNTDVSDDCNQCPIGHLILKSKNYLISTSESKYRLEWTKVIKQIKSEIKDIEPYPLFNNQFRWDKKRNPDILLPLRELQRDLDYVEDADLSLFALNLSHEENFRKRVLSYVEKEIAMAPAAKLDSTFNIYLEDNIIKDIIRSLFKKEPDVSLSAIQDAVNNHPSVKNTLPGHEAESRVEPGRIGRVLLEMVSNNELNPTLSLSKIPMSVFKNKQKSESQTKQKPTKPKPKSKSNENKRPAKR